MNFVFGSGRGHEAEVQPEIKKKLLEFLDESKIKKFSNDYVG